MAKNTFDPELTVEDLAIMTPMGDFFREEEDEWKRYSVFAPNFGAKRRLRRNLKISGLPIYLYSYLPFLVNLFYLSICLTAFLPTCMFFSLLFFHSTCFPPSYLPALNLCARLSLSIITTSLLFSQPSYPSVFPVFTATDCLSFLLYLCFGLIRIRLSK